MKLRTTLCRVFAILIWITGTAFGSEFGYSGDIGPGFWAELDPAWEACGSGISQTPINITKVKVDSKLKRLNLDVLDTELDLINNGHTIEQEYEPGSTLTFEGIVYELLQFHFHTFSEHTVRGIRYPMEMHAVFKNEATGNLAVIGTFFKVGNENEFLAEFDDHLPRKSGDHFQAEDHINLLDALTDRSSYYSYSGSLTTPPCSPIVTWIVLQKPATFTHSQFRAFQDILGNNFRPLQPLNDRIIRRTPKHSP